MAVSLPPTKPWLRKQALRPGSGTTAGTSIVGGGPIEHEQRMQLAGEPSDADPSLQLLDDLAAGVGETHTTALGGVGYDAEAATSDLAAPGGEQIGGARSSTDVDAGDHSYGSYAGTSAQPYGGTHLGMYGGSSLMGGGLSGVAQQQRHNPELFAPSAESLFRFEELLSFNSHVLDRSYDFANRASSFVTNHVLRNLLRFFKLVRRLLLPMKTDEDWRFLKGKWVVVNKEEIEEYYARAADENDHFVPPFRWKPAVVNFVGLMLLWRLYGAVRRKQAREAQIRRWGDALYEASNLVSAAGGGDGRG